MSRTGLTIVLCAAAAIVAAAYLLVDERAPAPTTPVAATAPVSTPPAPPIEAPVPEAVAPTPVPEATASPPPSRTAATRPVTPRYRDGPRAAAPDDDGTVTTTSATGAIFRCSDGATTTYRQEPCDGGTVVRTGGAAEGYSTRPSAGLERLVAEGREEPPADVVSTSPSRAMPGPATSVECRTYRQQIADLDAEARQTTSTRRLDTLRRIRQDIGDSLVRARC